MMSGYVYLIGTPIFGWYKIGKSITPEVRIKDLGILLPFKLHIIGVWKAENHHMMETALHEMYADHRINGEWFEFDKAFATTVFNSIPVETRIYPNQESHSLDKFSNVVEDTRKDKKIIGVRTQKLRGDFTDEERHNMRIVAMGHQRMKRILGKTKCYSLHMRGFVLLCNKPNTSKKLKVNIFTSLIMA